MSRQTSLFDYAFSGGGSRPRQPQNQRPEQPSSESQASSSLSATNSDPPTSSSQSTTTTSRGSHSSRGRGGRRGGGDRSNPSLASVSEETRAVLPSILPNLRHLDATKSESLHLSELPPLKSSACPGHPRPKIKIVNEDTLNAAIDLAAQRPDGGRVAVLNMASDIHAGGGWLKGAVAQEEAICYRSSLYLSLHKRHYPFRRRMGLYTPDVVVIRGDMASGHKLLVPGTAYTDLPVVSVLSIAAIRRPEVQKVRVSTSSATEEVYEFARANDRVLTMDKMRLCLRMAAARGHSLLVLGALGCGAFRNPPEEIAQCWLEVLGEAEFAGGWWREMWFAVYDRKNEGNFEIFEDYLAGVEV
ncbi:mitochondrial chaperone bcs1 [Colletotrichum truncatum]|uniref:Mitochondrial chaperone bcs1 n=1 Tax=Colletotrichum truncatum TaxID=5467 RepID=A0ACC3YWI1_COLTU|nr:mitochondrial chaperone bcs1 [Colletotrichum truncatum]KAF6787485.1 mitochondrial chaperone bcs1 [Colletotrichum truncatum]